MSESMWFGGACGDHGRVSIIAHGLVMRVAAICTACEEQSGTDLETETIIRTDDQTCSDGGPDGGVEHREARDSM